jgi:hypothetical protein
VKEGAAQLANAEPGAWGKFVGQAATKDAAATGMGGLGGLAQTGMAAAAPVLMATPEGPEAPDYGPMPEYEFDWNSVYAPGGGFTRKMAAGGETAPKMSGASAQAMDYLMGRASVSPQALAVQQRVAAAPKVVPTTTKATLPASKGDAPAYTFDPMTKQFTAAPVVATPSPFAASEPQEYDYRFAQGGQLQAGGFVVPADVVSALGNGSSSAGLETLARKFGARPIKGPGDGMSDSIPTSIDGRQKARVARDEAYVPPDRVQAAGGAKKLYAMMDRIRSQAHGKTSQQRKINPDRLV